MVPSSSGLASVNSQENLTRPMTAVRGAGFTSSHGHRGMFLNLKLCTTRSRHILFIFSI